MVLRLFRDDQVYVVELLLDASLKLLKVGCLVDIEQLKGFVSLLHSVVVELLQQNLVYGVAFMARGVLT